MRTTGEASQEQGFTLIELLVVIVIIGVLAGIAIPIFLNQREKGYDAQVKSDLRNVALLEEDHFTASGSYSTDVGTSGNAIVYKQSANAGPVTAYFTSSTGAGSAAQTATTYGYCLFATSESGRTFYYNSVKGGLNQNCS